MKNKDLFILNPDDNNLINDGVVEINTNRKEEQGLKIIRHELKTFVCEGEYQKGLYRILDTYLKNIDLPKQPAVWVSGFFGSGKSHLVKMLSYIWEDFSFPNGDTARSLKKLPADVNDLLVELNRKQNIYGRLAVSGTLKDFPSSDIRYSFLQLLLKSLGLPQQFHLFKFVYWAKQEGIYDDLVALVESNGKDFNKELSNLFVTSTLTRAVLELRPELAENEAKLRESFKVNFKRVENISREEFISTIKDEILPMFYDSRIPCTLIVLDEVQQFIGQDGNKTIDIQNLAQDISSNFGGKFLLVCTGQNALAETPQLSPLQDRFSVKVMLSDTDVETVTRKTVLEKKASVLAELNTKLDQASGEISRKLSGTDFGYRTEDKNILAADYPILPSTRKFWKKVLQLIDTAGTSGLLRSQLRIVDESVKFVADREVGSIVPADFIFVQKQAQLLQNALLLNEVNNLIEERKSKGGDSELEGRILSIVFLIDLLPKDIPGGPLKTNESTIADLLSDSLNESSENFRNKVKALVNKLAVTDKILMPVGDEFKLQTKVGQEWEQEYTSQAVKVNNSGDDLIQQLRKEKMLQFFKTQTAGINILQGVSKLNRIFEIWDKTQEPNTESRLNVWIRDGWNENETYVQNEIRAKGLDSPLSYVFVGKFRDQDLRNEIIKYLAANKSLDAKGIPTSPEGIQARKSMETRRDQAAKAINELIDTICKEGKVYLAGGTRIDAGSLNENIREALNSIADRQFSEFKSKGDFRDWDKALAKALTGDPDALKKIGWNGEVKDHPIAIDILRYIGNGTRSGKDIRGQFMKSPYGWSQDSLDTMILMLLKSDLISTPETNLKVATIPAAVFKKEVHTLSASDKIKLRKFYQEAGISCKPGEEFLHSNTLMKKLIDLANSVSGDAPKPEPFNTDFIQEIVNLDGNERLLRILQDQEDLRIKLLKWQEQSILVTAREPSWNLLAQIVGLLASNGEEEHLKTEVDAIRNDRLLLNEPDLVVPLLEKVTDKLKAVLYEIKSTYIELYDKLMIGLQENIYFKKLEQPQKHAILLKYQLLIRPEQKNYDSQGLLLSLQKVSLDAWQTRIAALPGLFQSAIEDAVKLAMPKTETYSIPKVTLNSKAEVNEFIEQVKNELEELLDKAGSVMIK